MCENLKNPYLNMYHWVKGEIFDIESINNSLSIKDRIQEKIGKTVRKKQSTQENLDNLTTGRKTVKTLFKTQDDTGKMVSKIESSDKEIEALTVLLDILTIYLGEQIIPPFKAKKIGVYAKIVQ